MKSLSFLWVGNPLGPFEKLSIFSSLDRDLEVNLFTYDSEIGRQLPKEVNVIDGSEIMPRDRLFANHDRPHTFAGFSNLFRYKLLSVADTIWVDTDVLILDSSFVAGDYIFGRESNDVINGAVLSLPSESPVLSELMEKADSISATPFKWGALGPRLLTEVLAKHGLSPLARKREDFYPISWNETWKLFDPKQTESVVDQLRGANTCHWWNEVFREAPKRIKDLRPSASSFIGKMFSQYGISRDEFLEDLDAESVEMWRRKMNPTYLQRAQAGIKRRLLGRN